MEWINLKDKLPEYNDPVFLTKSNCVYVGVRVSTDIEGESYCTFDHPKQVVNDKKMTHWLPIEFPRTLPPGEGV